MLNECYELQKSIQEAGVEITESWHKDYVQCPNYATFRLLIDSDSNVTDIEQIAGKEQIKRLRKYEPANGFSFPAFNVLPLYHCQSGTAKEKQKLLKERIKKDNKIDALLIDEVKKLSMPLWSNGETTRISKCLKEQSETLDCYFKAIPDDFVAIKYLIERSQKICLGKLQEQIEQVVLNKVVSSPKEGIQWLEQLIFSPAKMSKKVSFVLELSDSSKYKYPANHEKIQQWINSQLMCESSGVEESLQEHDTDAYGQSINGSADKYPAASLPKLGNVTLRAMNSESPCQRRYGKADAESFCVGNKMRQRMKDCLEWLGKSERKGKTWQNIADGVLFAYPSYIEGEPPELAGLFGGAEVPGNDSDGAIFSATASRVVSALDGIVKERPDTEICLFVLAKADKARTKVLASRHYEAKRVMNAAKTWQDACQNIPRMNINIGTNNNDKAIWINPLIPFPIEVINCLNTIWFANGEKVSETYGASIGDGIVLLLEEGLVAQNFVNRAMQLAVVNSKTLLLALGHTSHRLDTSFKWNKDTAKRAKQANLTPSILGLLLYKFGLKKGEYMSTAPFLIGQIMSLADTLHKEYCRNVRADKKQTGEKSENSGMPRQLIGNAAMAVAMDNPTTGLARLAERILIYQSWANTSQNVGLAGWALNEFRDISEKLGKITEDAPLPERCNDAEKAQMLLGYLSRIGKE